MTRCFAFGCSLTHWTWGTCADLIGSNFDKYYNAGKPGASNGFIANRIFEADRIFKFLPGDDLVLVGMTGFGRLSFYKDRWNTHGDILTGDRGNRHPEAVDIFNPSWALYNSYAALISIKEYLIAKKINHVIYPAVDCENWATSWNINYNDAQRMTDIINILDVKQSLYGYTIDLREKLKTKPITFKDSYTELHPTQLEHYMYLQNFLGQYDTAITRSTFESIEKTFDLSSLKNQGAHFNVNSGLNNRTVIDHNSLFISKTQYV